MQDSSSNVEVIETECAMCVNVCGINAHVKDGKLIKVEGMPDHAVTRGTICPKGAALVEYVYSPDRIKYPLKKEDGEWKRTSWDGSLDIIAMKLKEIKEKYGAHALATYCGSVGVEHLEPSAFIQRFRGVYGTPNHLTVETGCWRVKIFAHQLTFGRSYNDEPENSKCILLWGSNPENSKWQFDRAINEGLEKGLKLIVIDPVRIPLAKKGLYAQIRPGTDCALALAMLNVIISEDLYDHEFVEKWTIGFDKLREHVKQYSPEKVEKITWVPAELIKQIARIYATTKPAGILQGTNSLDRQISGFQNSRVLCILQAVTGNVDTRGGWVRVPPMRLSDLRIPVEEKPIGADMYPLFFELWGRTQPYGHEMIFPDVVLSGKPYPIKALIIVGGNPALTLPDSKKVVEALKELELLVVIDLFMTKTAELAHFVLPACSFLETTGLGYMYSSVGAPYVMLRRKAIEPIGESWSDWKIISELGRKMGYSEHFPWKTSEEVVEHLLKPSGVTLKQLEENPSGLFHADKEYPYYGKKGFGTPSGKVELYSETLEKAGYDPLPIHMEPSQSPVSSPELAREYPLILTTGTRIREYAHAQLRNVPSLRKVVPDPLIQIHPSTARKYDVVDGEIVTVETKIGSIKIKVKTDEDIAPQVVSIPHGWEQANVCLLTSLQPGDPVSGYPEDKALLCRIKKI